MNCLQLIDSVDCMDYMDERGIDWKTARREKQETHPMNENPLAIKTLYFAACPKLETLCIHGLDFSGRVGKLMTRHNDEFIRRPSLLPEHFIARRFATTDKNGQFLFGIPNAIAEQRYEQQDGFAWRRKQRQLAREKDWDESMSSDDNGTQRSDGDEEDGDTNKEETEHEDEDEDEHEDEDVDENANNV